MNVQPKPTPDSNPTMLQTAAWRRVPGGPRLVATWREASPESRRVEFEVEPWRP